MKLALKVLSQKRGVPNATNFVKEAWLKIPTLGRARVRREKVLTIRLTQICHVSLAQLPHSQTNIAL